ncbi:MAG: hypothetical protein HQL31_02000 [Planctomycetes bacterium]|nr:hypothetical protein [Planctomycetota bacterium]
MTTYRRLRVRRYALLAWACLMAATLPAVGMVPSVRPVAEVVTPITGDDTDLAVFPRPKNERYSGQAHHLTQVAIEAKELGEIPAMRLLQELLKTWNLPLAEAAPCRIVLRLTAPPAAWQPAPDQGYRLTVKPENPGVSILIEGGGKAGLFYGLQTLRQLVHVKDSLCYVREAVIEDWPSVPFRGPASFESTKWKMNLHYLKQTWPPTDPKAAQRGTLVERQNWIDKHLETLGGKAKTPLSKKDEPLDDLDALLGDDTGSGSDQHLQEYNEKKRAELQKELKQLQGQIQALDKDYEKYKQSVHASLRESVAKLRDHHMEPIIYYKAAESFGKFKDHQEHVERTTRAIIDWYEIGHDIGVRKYSMNFFAGTGYEPQSPSDPTYGEIQARIVRRVRAWLKEKNSGNELFLEHQKNAVRIQPLRNHISGYTIQRSLDELAAEFTAAGIPEDLQIMWLGCGNPVPRITAEHAQTMSALFGGRRASYLNMQGELNGRILVHDLSMLPNCIGGFIGNGVMDRHDPELARHLTMATFPGWGNQLWSWNPEGYDRKQVTAGMMREWLREVGAGPAAYKELDALAQWQMENGAFAIIGVGWTAEAMLSDDQNRLTPEQVDERMARKRAFYEARLKALRAALPPTGDELYQRIEKEALSRLAYLDEFIAPALRARPVGKAVRATGPIRMDGVLDEPSWAAAPEQGKFQGLRGEKWAEADINTTFRVVYDDEHVFVAVRCDEPRADRIIADSGTEIKSVVGGDHVQLIIDHTGLKERGSHLTTTLHGQSIVGNEGHWSGARTDPGPLLDWQWPRTFEVKTAKTKGGWVAEFTIALKDLDPQYRPSPGRRWGFNVLRRRAINDRNFPEVFFQHRYSWQRTATRQESRNGGACYRGQILFCGALVFE